MRKIRTALIPMLILSSLAASPAWADGGMSERKVRLCFLGHCIVVYDSNW